jgi:polyhydroxyalkanoate synthesis repressor PhaR
MTAQGPKVIRKYANRKLYDTETSKYVTLKHLLLEISAGRDVQVLDNESKADITGSTLMRAIVESEDGSIDAGIAVNIIRTGGGLAKYLANLKNNTTV